MGQNLRIIPQQTTMDEFWSQGFSSHTMPEDYVHRFADLEGYSYTHLTATLQRNVEWQDTTIILTGFLPEVLPRDKRQQSPMVFSIKAGNVYVGNQVANILNIEAGDEIAIFNRTFNVKKVLLETGSKDDIRIYGHLHDVQEVLDLPDQINEIKALECLCQIESAERDVDPRLLAKNQLAEILPEGKVIMLQGIAQIRQKQRATMEAYLAFFMLVVLTVCGAWIAVLTMVNVRERRQEIGIVRALGHRSIWIAALFLGKSILIGWSGAIVGYAAGTALALQYGPVLFQITAKAIEPEYGMMAWVLIIAPIFAATAAFIPVAMAMAEDPADTLREQ